MPVLLVHFARYGPYHLSRLKAAVEGLEPLGWEVIGLETAGTDATYAWDETVSSDSGPRVLTAFPGRVHEEITAAECREVLHPMLDLMAPDAMAIAGWGSADARACLDWCKKKGARAIVMSETREVDGKRVWWKEWIKSRIIRRFDAALVGGESHRDYLVKLGMTSGKIRLGDNVVDNGYFAAEAAKWRNASTSSTVHGSLPTTHSPPYFLASNRFIDRKNLGRLVEAYGSYARNAETLKSGKADSSLWNLCLLGDGELKTALIAQCHRLGLQVAGCAPWETPQPTANGQPPTVFFPGFRQIQELPRFYAEAGCFVHPALEEPWGLVINEAMACALPILSSRNVGAAEELLEQGVNGYAFDAAQVGQIAQCLSRISTMIESDRVAMNAASVRILEAKCPTEAFGRGLAALLP